MSDKVNGKGSPGKARYQLQKWIASDKSKEHCKQKFVYFLEST